MFSLCFLHRIHITICLHQYISATAKILLPGHWLKYFTSRHIEILYYTHPRVSTDFFINLLDFTYNTLIPSINALSLFQFIRKKCKTTCRGCWSCNNSVFCHKHFFNLFRRQTPDSDLHQRSCYNSYHII